MAYPERLLTDDEEVLRDFRPHWRVLIVPIVWTLLLSGALVLLFTFGDGLEGSRTWLALAVVVGWASVTVPPIVRRQFTQYLLTTERLVVRAGIISRSGTEIPLENINDVHFSQRPFERLLRYGDVVIESAGQNGQSRLHDIPDPESFQAQVYAAREHRTLTLNSGHGGTVVDPVTQIEKLAALRDRGDVSDEEFEAAKARLLGGL